MRTKVFKSGNSQAVRIPKEFRLDTDEVNIEKVGDKLIITQDKKKSKWDIARESLKDLQGLDFEVEDLPLQERDIF